jgi:protein-tyrosine phosphatase
MGKPTVGRKWRRQWPVLLLAVAALAVVAFFLVTDWLLVEEPNYSLVEPGLYLGGSVERPPRGTRAVLNVCESPETYPTAEMHYCWEPIRDAAPAPSIDWLRRQVDFITEQRRADLQVFVHCFGGTSRSAMVVTAYLMERDGISRDDALAFLRTRRPSVRPNPAFMRLLLEWQDALKKPAVEPKSANPLSP